jgi:hypothetical protein
MSQNPHNEQRPEQVIDDPEEYSQKKRVRDLLDRRNEVIEARNRAIDAQSLEGVPPQKALRHYMSRIESLIIDLYTKFDAEEVDEAEHYLQDELIDTVTIYPPQSVIPDSDGDMMSGADAPEPVEIPIRGLEWFINTNDPIVSASFSMDSWNPPKTIQDTNSQHIPIRTLDRALLKCMDFMDEMGIDAKISTDKGDAGFNWEDFAENVPGENNE